MGERDFQIGSREFKLNKIDALKQYHIVRRLAPVLAELLPNLGQFQKVMAKPDGDASESDKLDSLAKIAGPFMEGLSKLSDADSDKVLFGLLSSVEIKQSSGNWAKVSNDTMLMMQDLELPILLQIAGRAFMFNLSGFFAALPQK